MTKNKILSIFLILSFLLPSRFSPISAEPLDAPLFAPVASVSIDAPGEVFIGEAFTIGVTFDNTSLVDVGFGPYVDVFLPQSGADDASAGQKEDGITYTSVDYLGNPIRTWDFTCAQNGSFTHPLTKLAVTCPAAPAGTVTPFTWQVLVVELPFGSFAPDQPPATITIGAQLSDFADLNLDLPIYAQAGYRFGSDEFDNPTADPPILGTRISSDITPTLFILDKIYNWREDETATGPNYTRQYTLAVDIPDNQTITNLVITDDLPINMQFVAVESTNPAVTGCTTPSTIMPGGTLSCTFASVTGSASAADATVTFSFYIPLDDSNGDRVIDPLTGGCVFSENPLSASADWDPLDPRDPATTTGASKDPAHILEDCSHTIQKFESIVNDAPPASYSPGDVIEYRLEFQVSDFFAEDAFTVTDTFSDGQRYDASFTPTLSIEGNTYNLSEAAFNAANFTVVPDYTPADPVLPNSGETTITYYVSNEIITRGRPDGRLIGGCVPTGGTGGADPDCGTYNDLPTTGVIRFRTIIQEEFSDAFPSGDESVDQGDQLINNVIATAVVLNNSDLSSTGNIASEDSAASFVIGYGSLQKSIYAINGSTIFSTPVRVTPGDTITYHLNYTLNTSDFEDLEFTDYLPLPVLDADELTIFDDVVSAAVPAPGHIKFGPADTFRAYSGILPVLSVDSLNNSFSLLYGNFDSVLNTPTVIDLLFTVTISNDPFADELYLTNQVRVYEGSTNHDESDETAIIQFILEEPFMAITKGAVSSSRNNEVYSPAPPSPVAFSDPGGACPRFAPPITSAILAADPITSDLSQVDAGDVVTFAVILENTGHTGAYDVAARDDLPAGFAVPGAGLNLCVTDGSGNALPFTDLGGGFLGTGIQLDDAAGAPALTAGQDAADVPNPVGENLAIITFDLVLTNTVGSADTITNTATLTNYANTEGGPDFTTENPFDDVDTLIRQPQSAKSFVTSNQAHTSGVNLVIGEIATFDLTITIPEGLTAAAVLTDNMPAGLAFVDCVSITPSSADLTTSLPGGFNDACNDPTNPTVANDGDLVTFTLGDLSNINTDNTLAETLTVRFTAVALNIASNQQGTSLSNAAVFSWVDGSQTTSPAIVAIVEPAVSVNKTAVPITGDAGDLITFDIAISIPGSSVNAYNLTLDDIVPAEITYTSSSFVNVSGLAPDTIAETPDLNAAWAIFPAGSTTLLRFTGTLKTSVTPGDRVTNNAIVKFTSLPDTPGQQSPYSPVSYERTGNQSGPGGTANDYTVTDPAYVDIVIPTPLKYLVATSEAHTTGTDVAIGEIVRYRISSAIPEGTSTAFQFRDLLPAGLLYINDGTARLAFVSNEDGITSSTITCANDSGASGNPADILSSAVDCVFPAGSITNAGSATAFAPGNDPWFNFGNLVNADSDADLEYVIVEFNALTVNIASNQAGVTHSNDFTVYEGGSQVADATNLTMRVVEPTLTVNKTVSAGPYDAGDVITYTVVVSASSAATATTAFDVIFSDAVNAALQVQTHSIVVPAYATATDTSAGNNVNYAISELRKGDTATVTITALIPDTTPAFLTIPNSAAVLYTSLPGANGTVPNPTGSTNTGIPGTQTGERTGQDGAGGLNDYAAQDPEPITISQPAIDKRDADPLVYTIGETVTFPILVTLPEGVTRALQVVDNLPPGLDYISSEVITSAAASGGLLALDFSGSALTATTTAPGGSGVDVTWAFGDVTTTADSGTPAPDNNRFLIRITARVMDIPLNSGGDILSNSASLRYTNPNTGATVTLNDAPVTISLIEPVMTITKTFNPDQAAINETVQVTLVVNNTGTSPAHDVIIEDPFPTTQFQSTAAVTTPADFVYESLPAGGNITVRYSGGPIEVGGSRTFVFTVTTNSGFIGGATFDNIATVTRATTLPGDNPHERDEPDVSANDQLNGISPDLVLTKDDGRLTADAGDTLVYTLTIDNVGLHDAINLTVTDTVPDGTVFDSANSDAGWDCLDGAPAGSVCTLDIAGLASGAQTAVNFGVRVDQPLGAGITQIANTASVADDGTYGPDPTPANNSDDDVDTLADTSPEMSVEKVDALLVDANANGMASAGDTLRYTVTIVNNGDQDAGDVVFSDTPGANLTLVAGTVNASQGSVTLGNTLGDTSLSVSLGEISGGGGSATVQFNVTINNPLPANVAYVENQGVISGDNFPDVNSDDPDYPGGIDPTITLLDTSFLKTLVTTDQAFTAGTDVAIGEIVDYAVTLNVPPGETRLAVLTDTLDRGLAFVDCVSITPANGNLTTDLPGGFNAACASPVVGAELPGSLDAQDQGRRVTYDLGNLSNSTGDYITLTVRYQAVVLDSLPNQDGLNLNNAVTWAFEGGSLTTAAEAVTIVEPDLRVVKSANRTTAINGTLITFSLHVSHTTASNTDAFDVSLLDTLPPQLSYQPGTLTQVSGPAAVLDDTDPTNLRAYWAEYLDTDVESVIQFQAQVTGLAPGQSTRNAVALAWSSLPGDETLPRSVYNTLSTERFFDPPSDVDVYGTGDDLLISRPAPTAAPTPTPVPTLKPKPTLPATK